MVLLEKLIEKMDEEIRDMGGFSEKEYFKQVSGLAGGELLQKQHDYFDDLIKQDEQRAEWILKKRMPDREDNPPPASEIKDLLCDDCAKKPGFSTSHLKKRGRGKCGWCQGVKNGFVFAY